MKNINGRGRSVCTMSYVDVDMQPSLLASLRHRPIGGCFTLLNGDLLRILALLRRDYNVNEDVYERAVATLDDAELTYPSSLGKW